MAKNKISSKQILIILIVILLGTSFYLYRKVRMYKNPDIISEKEVQDIVEKVGELIVLPPNETPTIATVSDPEALQSQPFFAEANKGDKVLIYTDAKKAILYDPEIDKIISVAPLTISDSQQAITTQDI